VWDFVAEAESEQKPAIETPTEHVLTRRVAAIANSVDLLGEAAVEGRPDFGGSNQSAGTNPARSGGLGRSVERGRTVRYTVGSRRSLVPRDTDVAGNRIGENDPDPAMTYRTVVGYL
jgi:hypothetical protein